MPRYRFTGPTPVVFVDIRRPDGSTWEPNPGDELDIDQTVTHPHLEPVTVEDRPAKASKSEGRPAASSSEGGDDNSVPIS